MRGWAGRSGFWGGTVRASVIVSTDNPSWPGAPIPALAGSPHARDGIGTRDDAPTFYESESLAADGRVHYAFTVRLDGQGSAVNTPPTAPAAPQPAAGAILFRESPWLAWAPSADSDAGDAIDEYRVEVEDIHGVAIWAQNTGSNAIGYLLPPEADLSMDQLRWRVAARDLVGALTFSPWWDASVMNTQTSSPPEAVALAVDGLPGGPALSDQPEFSWTFSDSDPGAWQSAFRIQVSGTADFSVVRWDSGQISDQAGFFRLPFAGALAAGESLYWRMKVWDEGYVEGPWSAAQAFTVRLRVIDGQVIDWSPLPGGFSNRAVMADGEWRWIDRLHDVRTESPYHRANDLAELRFTADEDFLYVFARFHDMSGQPHPPVSLLTLAVDTSRDGQGMDWIGDQSGTLLSSWSTNRIRADRMLDLSWDGVFVFDPGVGSWVEPPAADIAVNVAHHALEARIPLAALGVNAVTGFVMRLAAATFQRQGSDPNQDDHTAPFYLTDALDVVHPSFANSWEADLDLGRIEFFFDVPFSAGGGVAAQAGPLAPVLMEPSDGGTSGNLSPIFMWERISVAPGQSPPWYHIQVSASPTFSNRLYKMDALVIPPDDASEEDAVAFTSPYALIHGATYHWRVRALDGFWPILAVESAAVLYLARRRKGDRWPPERLAGGASRSNPRGIV
jgi:hypothetical protein